LGTDVFKNQTIGEQKAAEMREVFVEINKAILSGHVSKASVVATSAFRDAKNGKELLESLASEFNLNCQILSGFEEASYMSEGLKRRDLFDQDHTHLHMDIGGGSLELSVFEDGAFLFQESLNVGALRLIENTETGDLKADFEKQLNLIDECLKDRASSKKPIKLYGTGGNFKRLGVMNVESFNAEDKQFFTRDDAAEMLSFAKKHPGQNLCKTTTIKPDNAALILPSLMIIERVFNFWPAERIEVPDLTLSHTILDRLI
jgi:exopolyphosphatase/guanosine-5'-triphosphate,3'-diphosphate pyrophosphatase